MTAKTIMNNPVIFTESSLQWLMDATSPDEVDPKTATHGQLVWNACLLSLQKKIKLKAEQHGQIR